MAGPHIAPDGLDILTLAETNPGDAPAVVDARRPRHDGTDDAVEGAQIMDLEQRAAGIKPFKPHAARVHAEFFVERLAEQRLSSDP